MKKLSLLAVLISALTLTGCAADPEPEPIIMPDVVELTLEVAESDIKRAGVEDEVEVLGGGTLGVWDKANWKVCEQEPRAGTPVTDLPRLTVKKDTCEEPTTAPPGEVPMPNVVGKTLYDAKEEIRAAGYTEPVAKEGGDVWAESNWEVCEQHPAAGTTITDQPLLTVKHYTCEETTPEAEEASAEETTPAAEEATSGGVDLYAARAACTAYAERQFPYGVDFHSIMGNLHDGVQNDQWFWKVKITVTNAFNAEEKGVMECYVGGTQERPIVEDWLAY